MASPVTPHNTGQHLVLYDGVCGLCEGLVRFILQRDHRAVFNFGSLQSDFGCGLITHFGENPDRLDTFFVVKNYRSPSPVFLSRARAALFVGKSLGGVWRWLTVFGILPDGILNLFYNLVARNRYRLFGRRDTCMMPSPEYRSRFVDH